MDLTELKTVSEVVQSWLSSAAVLVGGGWILWRFVFQRESHPRIEFALELHVLGRVRDQWLVNVVAAITNRGTVRHYLRDFWCVLNELSGQDPIVMGGDNIDGQVQFRSDHRRRYWIRAARKKYFIDAGVTQKYTHVASISAATRFVLVYGYFRYPGFGKKYQSVQQAFALPDVSSNRCDAVQESHRSFWFLPAAAFTVAGLAASSARRRFERYRSRM